MQTNAYYQIEIATLNQINTGSDPNLNPGLGMNPAVLPLAIGKSKSRVGSLILWKPKLIENSEFKPVKLRLKIHFVSHSAHSDELSKYI